MADTLKLDRQRQLDHSLTLRVEKLNEDYSLSHGMQAYNAEDELSNTITDNINDTSTSQNKNS